MSIDKLLEEINMFFESLQKADKTSEEYDDVMRNIRSKVQQMELSKEDECYLFNNEKYIVFCNICNECIGVE